VALKGAPTPEVLAALHGVWKAGAVLFPIDPRWARDEEEQAVGRCEPRVAMLGEGALPVPGLEGSLLALGARERREALPLKDLPRDPGPLPAPGGREGLSSSRPAAVLLTSGTSGRARRVLLSYANLRASALGARHRLGLGSADAWLASLSLAHVGGLALVSRSALLGSSLFLDGSFRPDRLRDLVSRGAVTHASLVPTMLRRFLEAWGDVPPPTSLRCLLIGGARADDTLVDRALSLGFPLALTYGLTEATSQVATAPPDLVRSKPGTVGPPLLGVELRFGSGGEILVKGPTVAQGLAGPEGWLQTGDLGRLDGDGHLWVTGRISHRIISGGLNVDPAEVEEVLGGHPRVKEIVVVGVPDPEWGERVVAAVVVEGGDEVPGELDRIARAVLSPAKRPKDLRLVESLPRNPNGKVDRERVRRLFDPSPSAGPSVGQR
jgi:O-succinylbenzoic acid--CoA ligase